MNLVKEDFIFIIYKFLLCPMYTNDKWELNGIEWSKDVISEKIP
jgi:hypothetical protein